jgi:DNA-nicking Smr family endonuclease
MVDFTVNCAILPDNDDEQQLLKAAYQGVQPISYDTYQHPRRKPKGNVRRAMIESEPYLPASRYESLTWLTQTNQQGYYRPGQRTDILKRMGRKNWLVQNTIDLHGMNKDQAENAVALFLQHSQQRGWHRLCIIHGKGINSMQGAILLPCIQRLLLGQANVLAFTHPAPAQGGTGATLVLLKTTQPSVDL